MQGDIHLAGLRLIQSNRLEILSEALAVSLSEPLSSPLTKETVVVQSRGMQRWLSLELARMYGICANMDFPFPNAFVADMFTRLLTDMRQDPLFEKETMAFRIMDILPGMLDRESFASIRDYLKNDSRGLKLYQLSAMLAHIFDQYVLFRPAMVIGWEEGGTVIRGTGTVEGWQADLWRKVIDGRGTNHRARLKSLFLEALAHADPSRLPERASVFGISYLPPFHLDILKALSSLTEISLYILNPCREYWADIMPERRIARIESKGPAGEELHLEVGNELLASLGMLGRNFLDMVLDLDPEETDLFEESGCRTMLECIQDDILNLKSAGDSAPRELGVDDRSIQVHSCHSPMREVEVLLDTLLRLFEEIEGLSPKDILVMAPDIEVYAPFIRAVFDLPREDRRRIPYSISDRSLRQSSKLTDAFLAVLDLTARRFEASIVMDLLDREPVRDRFGINEGDLRKIRSWVTDANIRWGRDGKDRQLQGLPGFEENTWSFGIRRLLLGYAMAPGTDRIFEDIAPYDNMDPASAEILGAFIEYADRLFSRVEELKQERDLAEWSDLLLKIVDDLFAVDDDGVSDLLRLKSVIRGLANIKEDSLCTCRISVDVLKDHVSRAFSRPAEGSGFLEHGATFCSMLPMRSIPFKVICLMGMNHESFPRRDFPGGFDLMAMHTMKGDRSRREDDLYLFLEALLSARKVFCMSYVGQGIQDNSAIPPSVVVSGLLEYLDKAFVTEGAPAGKAVVMRHCLQAFSPRYFISGTGLFSYSRDNALAAKALRLSPEEKREDGELGEPDQGFRILDTERFISFFRNPAGFFLRYRLSASLPAGDVAVEDREPFDLRGFQEYAVRKRLLMECLEGGDPASYLALLRAEGSLPHGMPGEIAFREIAAEIDEYVPLVRKHAGEGRIVREDIAVELDGFVLTGSVDSAAGGFIRFRHADIKAEDLLRAWISHLLLQAGRPGREIVSRHLGKKKQAVFSPAQDPDSLLEGLLKVYWQGLKKPLHFFPRSSHSYAEAVLKKGQEEEKGLRAAYNVWNGNYGYSGAEADNGAYQVFFADKSPFDAEFTDLAKRVYGPMMAHLEVKDL
jgi:exodeoxyribonuclease V gamma subunit